MGPQSLFVLVSSVTLVNMTVLHLPFYHIWQKHTSPFSRPTNSIFAHSAYPLSVKSSLILSVMDGFTGLDKNFMCSDSEIEAFFAATSVENDVSFKKEPILIDDHEPETDDVPKPMKELYEEGPTPFLKKTFAMVNDSQTDSIISWSETEMSFVIWDHHKFTADILPKHFKHCNFSSFIRQLNTYVSDFDFSILYKYFSLFVLILICVSA